MFNNEVEQINVSDSNEALAMNTLDQESSKPKVAASTQKIVPSSVASQDYELPVAPVASHSANETEVSCFLGATESFVETLSEQRVAQVNSPIACLPTVLTENQSGLVLIEKAASAKRKIDEVESDKAGCSTEGSKKAKHADTSKWIAKSVEKEKDKNRSVTFGKTSIGQGSSSGQKRTINQTKSDENDLGGLFNFTVSLNLVISKCPLQLDEFLRKLQY